MKKLKSYNNYILLDKNERKKARDRARLRALTIIMKQHKEDYDKVFNEEIIKEHTPKKVIRKLNIFEGLTEQQKDIIVFLVEKRNHNPLGFNVLVNEDKIYYFGQEILHNSLRVVRK